MAKQINTFDELGLRESLLRGVFGYGFERPSPIQKKAIAPMLTSRDIIAQSQSGTGKTGTFSIGTLQMINPTISVCQAVIIAPTRELAEQINDVFIELGSYEKVKTALCIGGVDIRINRKELDNGACCAIGTPGRIKDLMSKKYLKTNSIKMFVMDEADELLKEGFIDQIQDIVGFLPRDCQMCIFSATLPPKALEETNKFMNDPIEILVEPDMLTLDEITQFYVNVEKEMYKFGTLCDLYNKLSIGQTIIYANSTKKAEWLHDQLIKENFTVSLIHGSLSKVDRNKVMKEFRKGETRILVTTDLLCRGIDIEHVTIVINFDLPRNREAYLHRIGRTGRFGRKGIAINFVTHYDTEQLRYLQKYFGVKIEPLPIDIAEYFV